MGRINKRSTEFKIKVLDYYINNDVTRKDVAIKFGCSDSALSKWAKQLNYEPYFGVANYRGDHIKLVDTSEVQKQVILGTLLGDGCINCAKKTMRRRTLYVGHGWKQRSYLLWKHKILCGNKIYKYKTGFGSTGFCFTMTRPFIEEVWKSNYVDDVKCVSVDWVRSLTPLGLAVWYQDDGSWGKNGRYVRKDGKITYYCRVVTFSTHSFDQQSIKNIMDGMEFLGYKTHVSNTQKGPVLGMSPVASIKFLNDIAPFVFLKHKCELGQRNNGEYFVDPAMIGSQLDV